QRQYDRRVNKRLMQTQESKIDMGKAVTDDLVVTENSRTESEVQDDNSRSGNDTDAHDADIRPIYDEEPKAKVQLTTECNIFAIRQQHTEQPEIINEGRVDKNHCQTGFTNDETGMASDQNSSDPAPECQTMASDQNSSDPAPECQTMASDQNSSDPAPECQTMASDQNSSDPA
nr:hypothetical protein [Tanacetum cinerariifolium]